MNRTCAARLSSGGRCGKPASEPDLELRDVVCAECARRLTQNRWRRAYHEAGRAVVLDHLGARATALSLQAPGLLSTRTSLPLWSTLSAEDRCVLMLAGSVAVELGAKTRPLAELDPSIGDPDLEYARRYARSQVQDENAAETYLQAVQLRAARLMADRRASVEGLATALFERLRFNANETAAIMATTATED
jgi:hypothetical protein